MRRPMAVPLVLRVPALASWICDGGDDAPDAMYLYPHWLPVQIAVTP
jgi:hypothetical protein